MTKQPDDNPAPRRDGGQSGYQSIHTHDRAVTEPVSAGPGFGEQIRAHVERHIGVIDSVVHERSSEPIHIDVHHVAPVASRPYHTIFTTGMSDRPMQVPADVEAPAHLELMMTLPEHWKWGDDSDQWHWPIRHLQLLARLPHLTHTWLGWGHTVPNGDPAQPLAASTKLCGAIIAPSLLVSSQFYELLVGERKIVFYSAIPLYLEEMDFARRHGMEALLSRFIDHDISDVIQPRRRNVAKRFFGLF